MHFLSEQVHNAAVWLLHLYGPFPLNVLYVVFLFFVFFFPSSFHIKWLFFVAFQTHFPTGNLQSALWWTNYASPTFTTWLKSVSPMSSLIFQLLFISCCKCNIKTSAKTIGQLRNCLGSSFFKFFSLSFLGFVPWSKYKHSQGIFPLPSLTYVAMLAPIHFLTIRHFWFILSLEVVQVLLMQECYRTQCQNICMAYSPTLEFVNYWSLFRLSSRLLLFDLYLYVFLITFNKLNLSC